MVTSSSSSALADEGGASLGFSLLSPLCFCFLFCTLKVFALAPHMQDRSSWQEDEARRVLGLHRVSMVIWVLKLLLLLIDGC